MHKQVFMKQLRRALRVRFTSKETADILADYEGFFATAAEGQSEAQICTELGSPASIAADLGEALGKSKRVPVTQVILRILLTYALLIISMPVYFSLLHLPVILGEQTSPVRTAAGALVMTGFAVVLWFTLGGRLRSVAATYAENPRIWPVLAGHILLVACAVIAAIWWRIPWVPNVNHVIILLTALSAVYGFCRVSPYFFTLTVHAAGTILFNFYYGPGISDNLAPLLAIYASALLLAAAFAVYIRAMPRLAKGGCGDGSSN